MIRTWVYADPHLYHGGVCRFTNSEGVKIRPWTDAILMSEEMIAWYNDLVDHNDRVYVMGDVAMNRKGLDLALPLLKGRKVLVKGNHDIDKMSYYTRYFDDIRACVPKKGFVLTHIPIHPGCLGRWNMNIHGHIHNNRMTLPDGSIDERFQCVSVEHTKFKPILLDEVLSRKFV